MLRRDVASVPERDGGAGATKRRVAFKRLSIGNELSLAVKLGKPTSDCWDCPCNAVIVRVAKPGILPGGVDAITGRKGPQATQGSANPESLDVVIGPPPAGSLAG